MELSFDDRIRQRAYELWDASGRLDGQAEQHWSAAEREVLEQINAPVQTEKTLRSVCSREREGSTSLLPDKRYGVIVADQEWRFEC